MVHAAYLQLLSQGQVFVLKRPRRLAAGESFEQGHDILWGGIV